jgi:hypothetical protein
MATRPSRKIDEGNFDASNLNRSHTHIPQVISPPRVSVCRPSRSYSVGRDTESGGFHALLAQEKRIMQLRQ